MTPEFFDIESLTREVTPDRPCGPDLRASAEQHKRAYELFEQMEEAAQRKPAHYMAGQRVAEPREPRWSDALDLANRLWEPEPGSERPATRDLRVAGVLVRGTLATESDPLLRIASTAEGADLLCRLLQKFWEVVHPRRVFARQGGEGEPIPVDDLLANLFAASQLDNILREFRQTHFEDKQGGRHTIDTMERLPNVTTGDRAAIRDLVTQSIPENVLRMSMVQLRDSLQSLERVVAGKLNLEKLDSEYLLTQTRGAVSRLIECLGSEGPRALTNRGSDMAKSPDRPNVPQSPPGQPDTRRPQEPNGRYQISRPLTSTADVRDVLNVVYEYLKAEHGSNMARIFVGRAAKIATMTYEDAIANVFPDKKTDWERLENGGG